MKLFLKQRNMYYMKYWCKHVNDADVAAELSRVYLQEDSDRGDNDASEFFNIISIFITSNSNLSGKTIAK